jgi:hypothetical protein
MLLKRKIWVAIVIKHKKAIPVITGIKKEDFSI